MGLHYGYLWEIITSASKETACNWFSYFYSFILLYLVITTIVFITGYSKASKKAAYILYFWISAIVLSGVATISFRLVCQQPLPRRDVLAYFQ